MPEKVSLKGMLLTYLIGAIAFVGVPGLITFLAPVTQIKFLKQELGVSAQVTGYLYLVVPLPTQTIAQVKEIQDHVRAARNFNAEERRRGHRGTQLADGTLTIIGTNGQELHVTVDPSRLKPFAESARQYLNQPTTDSFQETVYAQWIISYVVGGIGTFFSALFVFGSIVQIPISLIRMLSPHGERPQLNEDTR